MTRKLALATCLAGLLAACSSSPSYIDAVTFDADEARSGIEGSYRAFWVTHTPRRGSELRGDQGQVRATEACRPVIGTPAPRRGGRAGSKGVVSDPLTGLVAAGVAGTLLDIGRDTLQSEVDELRERSKRSVVVSVNAAEVEFRGRRGQGTCLYVERRAAALPGLAEGTPADAAERVVFSFAAAISPLGDAMFEWRPVAARMSHAHALTGEGEPVTLDIAIASSVGVLRPAAGGRALPATVTSEPAAIQFSMRPSGDQRRPQRLGREELPVFPARALPASPLTRTFPATIALTITESGSASRSFEEAMRTAEDNLANLRTFLTGWAGEAGRQGRLR